MADHLKPLLTPIEKELWKETEQNHTCTKLREI